MKFSSQACAVIASFIIALPAVGASNATEQTDSGNNYIGGGNVNIGEPVRADLFAAGGNIDVEKSIGADGTVAGGEVRIRAPVGQDLRVAGGTVNIEANVGGELAAAGGTVKLADSSVVSGSAMMSGGEVILDGKIGKDAKIYANKIIISGEIGGDARLHAREIIFKPGAKIRGNLSYASTVPLSQDITTYVTGTVTHDKTPDGWDKTDDSGMSWGWVAVVLSMLAAGALLILLFPNAIRGTQTVIRKQPGRALIIGLVLLCAVPPAAIIFMVTIIGIPIGLVLLVLYPVMLLLGYLGAALFIARLVADAMKQPPELTAGRQILFLALALIVLSLASKVPVLGGIIVMIALIAGIGGWGALLHMRYESGKDATRPINPEPSLQPG